MQRGNGAVIGKQNTPTTSVATGVWALNEVQRAVLGGTWPSAVQIDPYFEYNTLLLHGNGTNGAQNNTFLDSSTNNFTITRNGNTTQGTFTPYGDNWSNSSFSGSNYLTYNPGATAAFGTGDFTVEAWVFATDALASGDNPYICDTRGGGGAWSFSWNYNGTSNPWQLAWANSSVLQSSTSMNINTWNHCAYVRSGTTGTLYLNGVSVGTWTDSYNYSASVTSITIGRRNSLNSGTQYLPGYLSNFRIVKGTAVYTSAFTPSTAPLTAITNTVLLTCQSNRFIDNSTNAFAITRNGDVSVQRFSPFNPTTPYAAGTIGGSGYFDGSGDYLEVASNSAFTLGSSGDFTVEAWIYLSEAQGSSPYANVLTNWTNTSTYTNRWSFAIASTTLYWFNSNGSGVINTTVGIGEWVHIAAVRSGSTITVYKNGVSVGTQTTNQDYSLDGPLRIGNLPTYNAFKGYIAGARIVKGTAVYTSAFTPPTAPLTAITNTSFLANFTNGGIIDNAMMNDLETVGNAQISTSVSKFGGGSLAFDGSGDYLTTYGTPQFAFGAGDFTIECWVYFNSLTQYDCIIDFRPSGTNGAYPSIFVDTSNTLVYYVSSANRITSSAVSTGQWYHLAVSRTGTSTKMFLNGVQTGSTYTDSSSYLVGNPLTIGGLGYNSPGTYALDGYIDDLRITKGYARYTADFTPPTLPFPDQ